jgi:hypothetical protein
MSLRGTPVELTATLPDGRVLTVWVGVPNDSYIRHRDIDTVSVELRNGDDVLATVNSVLEPSQVSEGLELAREIAAALEAGEVEPTAGAIEYYADRVPG